MIKILCVFLSLFFMSPLVGMAADEPICPKPAKPGEPIYLKPLKSADQTNVEPAKSAMEQTEPYTINILEEFISKKNAPLGQKSAKAVDLGKEWINRRVLPSVKEKDGSVVYTYGATMPFVVCRPLRVSVLMLEQGEQIIDVPRCGDTVRWEITC